MKKQLKFIMGFAFGLFLLVGNQTLFAFQEDESEEVLSFEETFPSWSGVFHRYHSDGSVREKSEFIHTKFDEDYFESQEKITRISEGFPPFYRTYRMLSFRGVFVLSTSSRYKFRNLDINWIPFEQNLTQYYEKLENGNTIEIAVSQKNTYYHMDTIRQEEYIGSHKFKGIGKETVSVPAGEFNTFVYDAIDKGSRDRTWVSIDHGLIVKIESYFNNEKGEEESYLSSELISLTPN